jgi:cell division protein FtsQ
LLSKQFKVIIFASLLLSLMGTFWLWILDPRTLPITTVRIEGELQHTDPHVLQAMIFNTTKGGFFNINLTAVRSILLSSPWIKNVQVKRLWPDTLLIRVKEYTIVAQWSDKTLIDNEGHLLDLPDTALKNQKKMDLPRFAGPAEWVGEILKHYNALAPQFAQIGLHIREFGCNAQLRWYIVFDNGMKLRLGRSDIKIRLQRFMTFYKSTVTQSLISSIGKSLLQIDLRYSDGIAVQSILAK